MEMDEEKMMVGSYSCCFYSYGEDKGGVGGSRVLMEE